MPLDGFTRSAARVQVRAAHMQVRTARVEALVRGRNRLLLGPEHRQPRQHRARVAPERIGLVRPVELPRARREARKMMLRALVVAHHRFELRGVRHDCSKCRPVEASEFRRRCGQSGEREVCIAFFLNTGAYYGEILRAGIESVPSGQTEAARSTGRVQTMLFVVLPQAVRNVLPELLSNTLEVVKLTSLGSVVAMPELLFQARQAQSLTYSPTPIVLAALIYFLMLWPLVRVLRRLENRALAGRG